MREKGCERIRAVKPWILGLFVICLITVGMGSFAAEASLTENPEHVFDYVGLFDENAGTDLEELAGQLEEEMEAAVLVLTVEESGGLSARETADSFYFDNGYDERYGEDGLVFLIDMDNREIYLGTYGDMIDVMTDRRIQAVLDEAYGYVSDGAYAEGAEAALLAAESWYKRGVPSNQYEYQEDTGKIIPYRSIRWYEAFFAVSVSALTAGSVCLGVVRQYKMRDGAGEGNVMSYQSSLNFRFGPGEDRLLHTAVTHVLIPRRPPGGGGRGGGHMGMGSRPGRSTTHSYGGHRAGGGGRKF